MLGSGQTRCISPSSSPHVNSLSIIGFVRVSSSIEKSRASSSSVAPGGASARNTFRGIAILRPRDCRRSGCSANIPALIVDNRRTVSFGENIFHSKMLNKSNIWDIRSNETLIY